MCREGDLFSVPSHVKVCAVLYSKMFYFTRKVCQEIQKPTTQAKKKKINPQNIQIKTNNLLHKFNGVNKLNKHFVQKKMAQRMIGQH